jgi:hypothetical protein
VKRDNFRALADFNEAIVGEGGIELSQFSSELVAGDVNQVAARFSLITRARCELVAGDVNQVAARFSLITRAR